MSRRRLLLILSLALGAAMLAGFAAFRYSSQQPSSPGTRVGGTQIVVAARDLPVGHFITDADVRVIQYPTSVLPEGYVSQASTAVGRGLIAETKRNSPLLEANLAERGSGAGLPIVFPEGMRAVSVRVDEIVGVAGFVTPRTRVDVLLTMKPSAQTEQTYTQTVLQNLLVLAAGQAIQKNDKGEPMTVSVVTLMVTPEEGEKLILASSQGRIQLALRNMLDVDEVHTPGIGDARLFDIGRQVVPRAASTVAVVPRVRTETPDTMVIETYKGGVRSIQRF